MRRIKNPRSLAGDTGATDHDLACEQVVSKFPSNSEKRKGVYYLDRAIDGGLTRFNQMPDGKSVCVEVITLPNGTTIDRAETSNSVGYEGNAIAYRPHKPPGDGWQTVDHTRDKSATWERPHVELPIYDPPPRKYYVSERPEIVTAYCELKRLISLNDPARPSAVARLAAFNLTEREAAKLIRTNFRGRNRDGK
jgi:hypothetical protein